MNINDIYLKFILCEKFESWPSENPYWARFKHRAFPEWEFYCDYNASKNRIVIEKQEMQLAVNFKVDENSITWDKKFNLESQYIKQRARKESTVQDIVLELGMSFDKDVSEIIAILQGKGYED